MATVDCEYVIHDDGEYVDGDVHVNTYESHRCAAACGSRQIKIFPEVKLTPYLRAFQLCREVFRNPGKEPLKKLCSKLCYDSSTTFTARGE